MGKEELEGGFKKGENLYSYRDGISWFSRCFISWREKQCMLYLSIEKAKTLWEISLRLHGPFFVFLHLAVEIPILPLLDQSCRQEKRDETKKEYIGLEIEKNRGLTTKRSSTHFIFLFFVTPLHFPPLAK